MADLDLPQTLDGGRYRIEKVLGTGGTAVVLLARDTRMGVDRAIKLLHPKYAASAESRTRIQREAHAQAALKHPNVLMVHDVVQDAQGVYLVMELAEADSLGERVTRTGPLPAREVAEVGVAIGGALALAHEAGLVHRDVKPANILVDRHGIPKLADFGIARDDAQEKALTREGVVIGTWAFMPPEQREGGGEVDARSDIYAFGVTLYALLTGRREASLHNQEGWTDLFKDIDPTLATILQRAVRLYPEDRYPRITEMVEDLKRYLAGAQVVAVAPSHPEPKTWVPVDTAVPEPETPPRPSTVGARMGVAAGILVAVVIGGGVTWRILSPPAETPVVAAAPVLVEPPPAEAPPVTAPPVELPPAPVPEPKAPVVKAPPTTPVEKAAPKVITVLSDPGGSTGATTPTPEGVGLAAATGTVILRTVPSGATVKLKGRALTPGSGGGYALPVGGHTLDVTSATGEQTRVAVSVKAGQTVEICYDFDTNSACGSKR